MSLFKTSTFYDDFYGGLRDRGYGIENARLDGRLVYRLMAPNGRIWITYDDKKTYPMNSPLFHRIADDKRVAYEVASKLGLHVPQTVYVDVAMNIDSFSVLLNQHAPAIVKPLNSYKSIGVTLNITTKEKLHDALEIAFQESPTAIIQEQVQGEEYRFTVLEGKVVSVLRRERPQVVGDGIQSICQLVRQENELRKTMRDRGVDYPEWTTELIGDSMASDEVLETGVKRILSSTTLVLKGASVYERRDETNVSYIEMAERFASEIGAGLCAVDMFLLDETHPAALGNYWFNECNASPALKMYAVARNADNGWVVEKIIETTDKYLNIT